MRQVDAIGARQEIVNHRRIIEWNITDLPGARFAKTGNGRIANNSCCLIIAKHENAAKMVCPIGIMPENKFVRHKGVLTNIATEFGELDHAVEHDIVAPGIGYRDQPVGEIAQFRSLAKHIFG